MHTTTTLGEVSNRIDQMSKNCTDRLINVQDISFDHLGKVNIAWESHPIAPIAQRSFCYRLGIPHQYLRRCPLELQAENMNHWIEKEKNKELLFRFDGDQVRALFTPKYKPVDNFEILERLDSLGYEPDTKVQCTLDSEFMLLSIPDGHNAFSVNGDRIMPGIGISNSEVGLASLSIAAFFLRLVCTNGLIAKTEVSASYRHVSNKILKEFPEVMEKVSYELSVQKSQFRLSMESRVDHPDSTMIRFNQQFALGKVEQEAVEWGWGLESGDTMFHVVNAYTRAARFPGLPASSSYALQKAGGNILGMLKQEGS